MRQISITLAVLLFFVHSIYAQSFCFTAAADPRTNSDSWKNVLTEMRDLNTNPSPVFVAPEVLLAPGDVSPLNSRYGEFLSIFNNTATRPIFFLGMGNHEYSDNNGSDTYAMSTVIPAVPGRVSHSSKITNYYIGHKNVRFITTDHYESSLGTGWDGNITPAGHGYHQ